MARNERARRECRETQEICVMSFWPFSRQQQSDEVLESIAHLVLVAKDDAEFRGRMEQLLQLPKLDRVAVVNSAVAAMRAAGEPEHAVRAFGLLAQDRVAEQLARMLTAAR